MRNSNSGYEINEYTATHTLTSPPHTLMPWCYHLFIKTTSKYTNTFTCIQRHLQIYSDSPTSTIKKDQTSFFKTSYNLTFFLHSYCIVHSYSMCSFQNLKHQFNSSTQTLLHKYGLNIKIFMLLHSWPPKKKYIFVKCIPFISLLYFKVYWFCNKLFIFIRESSHTLILMYCMF